MHRNCVCLRSVPLRVRLLHSSPALRQASGALFSRVLNAQPLFIWCPRLLFPSHFRHLINLPQSRRRPAPVAASAVARTRPGFAAGAGNKRVTIVSVRLSLIMKTAATLSLEYAFAITGCLAPAWNVTLLSMRLHFFSRQAAAFFRSPIAAAIKICSYWLWVEKKKREAGRQGVGGIWKSEFDFVCASFANHLAIAQHGDDLRATTSSLGQPSSCPHSYSTLFRSAPQPHFSQWQRNGR